MIIQQCASVVHTVGCFGLCLSCMVEEGSIPAALGQVPLPLITYLDSVFFFLHRAQRVQPANQRPDSTTVVRFVTISLRQFRTPQIHFVIKTLLLWENRLRKFALIYSISKSRSRGLQGTHERNSTFFVPLSDARPSRGSQVPCASGTYCIHLVSDLVPYRFRHVRRAVRATVPAF